VKSERIPSFLTHYYEAERGPFRNVCDLSDAELNHLIAAEKDAETAFNRFALGKDFFKIRRAADDLLIEKYREKFAVKPAGRPFYAVLGEFDRTLSMYRDGRSARLDISQFSREQVVGETCFPRNGYCLRASCGRGIPLPRGLLALAAFCFSSYCSRVSGRAHHQRRIFLPGVVASVF
jgi:hypothetical protein